MLDLGPPGSAFSEARAIDENGIVVGSWRADSGTWRSVSALWRDSNAIALAVPGWARNCGVAVNGHGTVVGNSNFEAVLWKDGVRTSLAVRESARSFAVGVNGHDQVIGRSGSHAFVWENGTVIYLGALPSGRFSEANAISTAYAINDRGQIVGAVARKDSPSGLPPAALGSVRTPNGWTPCESGYSASFERSTRYTLPGWEHAVLWTQKP